jgi:hypothetical protein
VTGEWSVICFLLNANDISYPRKLFGILVKSRSMKLGFK